MARPASMVSHSSRISRVAGAGAVTIAILFARGRHGDPRWSCLLGTKVTGRRPEVATRGTVT